MKEEDIIEKLEKIIYDKIFYDNCKQSCKDAYENEFKKEIMIKNYRYFIKKGFNSR